MGRREKRLNYCPINRLEFFPSTPISSVDPAKSNLINTTT